MFGRFGISGHGNYAYADLEPYGSHVALDHHLSSDQLQVMNAGSTMSRAEKLDMIAGMPEVQNNLRVCFKPLKFDPVSGGVVNCGNCEKCVRTMVGLLITDKLKSFTTFPKLDSPARYQRPDNLAGIEDVFLCSLLALAEKHGRDDWMKALQAARQVRRKSVGQAQP